MRPKHIGLIANTSKSGAREMVLTLQREFGRYPVHLKYERQTAALERLARAREHERQHGQDARAQDREHAAEEREDEQQHAPVGPQAGTIVSARPFMQ